MINVKRIEREIEQLRDKAPVKWEINPWPLAIALLGWLWLGIWLVERVFTR